MGKARDVEWRCGRGEAQARDVSSGAEKNRSGSAGAVGESEGG